MPRPDNRRGGRGGLTRPTPNVTPVFEETAGMKVPDLAIPETIARRQQGSEQRGQYSFGNMRPTSQNTGAELLEGLADAGSRGLDFLQRVQNRLAQNNEKDLRVEQDKINNGRYHVTQNPRTGAITRKFVDDPEELSGLYEAGDLAGRLEEASSQEKIAMFDLNTRGIQGKGFYFDEMRDAVSQSFGADDWQTYVSGQLNQIDLIYRGKGTPIQKRKELLKLTKNVPHAVRRKAELALAGLSKEAAAAQARVSVGQAGVHLRQKRTEALKEARQGKFDLAVKMSADDVGEYYNIDELLTDDQLEAIRSLDPKRAEEVIETLTDHHLDTVLAYQSELEQHYSFMAEIEGLQHRQHIADEGQLVQSQLITVDSLEDLKKGITARNNHDGAAGPDSKLGPLESVELLLGPFVGSSGAQRIAEGRGLLATFDLQTVYDTTNGSRDAKTDAVIAQLKTYFEAFPTDEQDLVNGGIDGMGIKTAIQQEIMANNFTYTAIGDDELIELEIEDRTTEILEMELTGDSFGLTRTQLDQPFTLITEAAATADNALPMPASLEKELKGKTVSEALGLMLSEGHLDNLTPDERKYYEQTVKAFAEANGKVPADFSGIVERVFKRLESLDRSSLSRNNRAASDIEQAAADLQNAQQDLSENGIQNGVTESLDFLIRGENSDNPFNQQVGLALTESARANSQSSYVKPRDAMGNIEDSKDPEITFGSSNNNTDFNYDFFADITPHLFGAKEIPFAAAEIARQGNPDLEQADHERIEKVTGRPAGQVREDFIQFKRGRRIMSTFAGNGKPLSSDEYKDVVEMMETLEEYYIGKGDDTSTGRFLKEKERLLFLMNPDPTALTLNAAMEAGLEDVAMTMFSLMFDYTGDTQSFNEKNGISKKDPTATGIYAATQAELPEAKALRILLNNNPNAISLEQSAQLFDHLDNLSSIPQHHVVDDKARTKLLRTYLNFIKSGSGEGAAGNINPKYVQRRLDMGRSLFITVDRDEQTDALSIAPARLTLEIAENQLMLDNPDAMPSPSEIEREALDLLASTSDFITAVSNYLPKLEGVNSDAEVQGYGILAAYYSFDYRGLTGTPLMAKSAIGPALAGTLTSPELVAAGREDASNQRGPNAFVLQVSEADLLSATQGASSTAVNKSTAIIDLAVEDLANKIATLGGFSIRDQEGSGQTVRYETRNAMTGLDAVINNNATWDGKKWVSATKETGALEKTDFTGLTPAGVDVTQYLYEEIKKRGDSLMQEDGRGGKNDGSLTTDRPYYYALAAQRLWKQTLGGDMIYFNGKLPNFTEEKDFSARPNLSVNPNMSRGDLNGRLIGHLLARNLAGTEFSPKAQAKALIGEDSNYTPLGAMRHTATHQGFAAGRSTNVMPVQQLVTDSKGNKTVRSGFAPQDYSSPPWQALTSKVMRFGGVKDNPHEKGTKEYKKIDRENQRLEQEQLTQPRQIADGLSIFLSDDGQDLPLNLEREFSTAILPSISALMITLEGSDTKLELDPFSFSMVTHVSILKLHPAAISDEATPATSPLFTEMEVARGGPLSQNEKDQVHAAMLNYARTIATVHSDLGIKTDYYTDSKFSVLYAKVGDETTRYSYGFSGNPYPETYLENKIAKRVGTPFGPWGMPNGATSKTLRPELLTTADALSWGQQLRNGRLFWSDNRHQEMNDNGAYIIHTLNNSRAKNKELPFPVFIGGTLEARDLRGN